MFLTGFLISTGVVFGRFICGYVCPMGFLQDLLYLIKIPKKRVDLKYLKYIKYIMLLVFVIILPFAVRHELSGLGSPWFCKYICPSGTIFGALPLISANEFLHESLGFLFAFKLSIAISVCIISIVIYRFFCRVLCPLGAFYSFFNKISLFRIHCDKDKCISCGNCSNACQLKINPAQEPNTPECIRCGKCVRACEEKVLTFKK